MEGDFYLVEFIYEGVTSSQQCNANDKMENIINKYLSKIEVKDKNSMYFLFSGNVVKEELTLKELIGKNISNAKKFQILVYSNGQDPSPDVFIKSKNKIICPECKEDIRLKINDYKIYLYDCKNGHQFDDILLNEFEDTQKINLTKIICNFCKVRNRGSTFDNEFYYCIKCACNLCPLCKNKHEKYSKNHRIISQKENNVFCNEHNDSFIKYCKDCKKNLCFSCVEKHKNHKIQFYEDIIPDMDMIQNENQNLNKAINQFENTTNHIIEKFKLVLENLKIYYQIYKELIDNFDKDDNNKRKYEIYQNINEFKNNIINELNNINENSNTYKQIDKIMEIYEKMVNKNKSMKDTNNIDNNDKIIICEKCYNIPKITFLNYNKINIECSKCRTSTTKDISYFDKFKFSKNDKNVFDLPNCSYNEDHEDNSNTAIKYCINCEEYLCEDCLKEHNKSFKNPHTLIDQTIKNDMYCKKEGHDNKKFNIYCM